MMETTYISKCCGAEVREVYCYEHVCKKCNRLCQVEEVCEYCLGTGEIPTDEDDGEGHTARGVGTRKCFCRMSPDEPENDL